MYRAYSRDTLDRIGFDYKSYSYPKKEGRFYATLDMKEWGKSPCLHCYFTTESGEKIRLIAYFDKGYKPNKSKIDFSSNDIKIGDEFIIITRISKNGNLRWEDAEHI